jgi:predicted nucleotidyltransferase
MRSEEVFVLEIVSALFLTSYEVIVFDRHISTFVFLIDWIRPELVGVILEVVL